MTVLTRQRVEMRGGRITVDLGDKPSIEVTTEPIVVGRDRSCQLHVAHPSVSAVHAELVATPFGVRVRDLGSKNGTWSGQLRVTEGVLSAADSVYIGDVELRFEPLTPERLVLPAVDRVGRLYGRSMVMREVLHRILRAAATDLTVLVQGETGTGKELVAQAIHESSNRAKRPFVVIDCASLAPGLAESTLFGHERGAFTGASEHRESPFLAARGGTIFLDELGELPLDVQPKLLRALAERRVKTVGGKQYVPFDARVVAATRRDLPRAMNMGEFRSDLYFRVAEIRIDVPPLRHRVEDIEGLVALFLAEVGASSSRSRIGRGAMDALLRHPWPGNVRELRNAVAVAVALAGKQGELDIAALAGITEGRARPTGGNYRGAGRPYHDAKRLVLQQFGRAYFERLSEESGGSITEMARRAGLQRTHVRRYMKELGVRGGASARKSGEGKRVKEGS